MEILRQLPALPGEILSMCAQHHENADGTGYPLGLSLEALDPWALLLKILDTFESLTSIRPWRAPLSSPRALKLMSYAVQEKSEFDTDLLSRLEHFWPEA